MDAILLAAGKGTRMAPLSPEVAKPLLPVAGRSLLHRMLDGLAAAGAVRTWVVVHHQAEQVRKEARAWKGRMRVLTVNQDQPRGTGHAVAAAARRVKGDALVVMGDAILDPATLADLASAKGFVLAAARVEDATRYGALKVAGRRVVRLAEKSSRPPSRLVNTGMYRVPAEVLEETQGLRPSPRGELEFTDLVNRRARRGEVRWLPAKGWMDIGAPWDLLDAQAALTAPTLTALLGQQLAGGPGTIEEGVHVRGRLYACAGALVRSGTYVEGDVWVGPGALVGPNAYLRGPTCIGPGCHVGAATEVKASLLMDGANAPHLNYIGDSILGPDVNLGAGTKVANLKVTPGTIRAWGPDGPMDTGRRKFGVCIGPRAKVGINCSMNPGTMVGAGSLVGAQLALSGWLPPDTRRLSP